MRVPSGGIALAITMVIMLTHVSATSSLASQPAVGPGPVPGSTVLADAAPAARDSPTRSGSPLRVVGADAPARAAVRAAVAYGQARGAVVAVAVYDLRTGRYFGGGADTTQFPSASVVKSFIAAVLLWTGKMRDPAISRLASRMITASDDGAASSLYGLVGADDLVSRVQQRYRLTGMAAPSDPGQWGETAVTARAVVNFYAAAAQDRRVARWLMTAMAATRKYGADGVHQHFGLPNAAPGSRVKQGWICCANGVMAMHTTGYVDRDRFAIAILTQGPPASYGGFAQQTLTEMARRLLPGGHFPAVVAQRPSAPSPADCHRGARPLAVPRGELPTPRDE